MNAKERQTLAAMIGTLETLLQYPPEQWPAESVARLRIYVDTMGKMLSEWAKA